MNSCIISCIMVLRWDMLYFLSKCSHKFLQKGNLQISTSSCMSFAQLRLTAGLDRSEIDPGEIGVGYEQSTCSKIDMRLYSRPTPYQEESGGGLGLILNGPLQV